MTAPRSYPDSQSEPVAWQVLSESGAVRLWAQTKDVAETYASARDLRCVPLYAAPQPVSVAQTLPKQADIKQIIAEGWRNGKSSAEVAEEIMREFEASPISLTANEDLSECGDPNCGCTVGLSCPKASSPAPSSWQPIITDEMVNAGARAGWPEAFVKNGPEFDGIKSEMLRFTRVILESALPPSQTGAADIGSCLDLIDKWDRDGSIDHSFAFELHRKLKKFSKSLALPSTDRGSK